jgi:hypothetical protein
MLQSCWRSSQQRSRFALGSRSAEQPGVLVAAFATEPARDLGNGRRPCPAALAAEGGAAQNERPTFHDTLNRQRPLLDKAVGNHVPSGEGNGFCSTAKAKPARGHHHRQKRATQRFADSAGIPAFAAYSADLKAPFDVIPCTHRRQYQLCRQTTPQSRLLAWQKQAPPGPGWSNRRSECCPTSRYLLNRNGRCAYRSSPKNLEIPQSSASVLVRTSIQPSYMDVSPPGRALLPTPRLTAR